MRTQQLTPVVHLTLTDCDALELSDLLNQARQCGAFRSAEQQAIAQEIENQIENELRQGQLNL